MYLFTLSMKWQELRRVNWTFSEVLSVYANIMDLITNMVYF